MIARPRLINLISDRLRLLPVVAIVGARQVGKTHLAKRFATSPSHYFDLEDPVQSSLLKDNASAILGSLFGTVVIDEIQERPELFPLLRVLADRRPIPARFVITGSMAWAKASLAESRRSRSEASTSKNSDRETGPNFGFVDAFLLHILQCRANHHYMTAAPQTRR
jgi:predicted AAA+ superfamily ATPase